MLSSSSRNVFPLLLYVYLVSSFPQNTVKSPSIPVNQTAASHPSFEQRLEVGLRNIETFFPKFDRRRDIWSIAARAAPREWIYAQQDLVQFVIEAVDRKDDGLIVQKNWDQNTSIWLTPTKESKPAESSKMQAWSWPEDAKLDHVLALLTGAGDFGPFSRLIIQSLSHNPFNDPPWEVYYCLQRHLKPHQVWYYVGLYTSHIYRVPIRPENNATTLMLGNKANGEFETS